MRSLLSECLKYSIYLRRPKQYFISPAKPGQQAAIKKRDSHQSPSALRVSKLVKAEKYFKVRSLSHCIDYFSQFVPKLHLQLSRWWPGQYLTKS